jgi:hypothetical protein
VCFDITDQVLIRLFVFIRYWRINESTMKQAYDTVRREVLYNILIEFWVPMKLVCLLKMYLNRTYSKVHIAKHLSDSFPIPNCLKQRDALSPLLFNFV